MCPEISITGTKGYLIFNKPNEIFHKLLSCIWEHLSEANIVFLHSFFFRGKKKIYFVYQNISYKENNITLYFLKFYQGLEKQKYGMRCN